MHSKYNVTAIVEYTRDKNTEKYPGAGHNLEIDTGMSVGKMGCLGRPECPYFVP